MKALVTGRREYVRHLLACNTFDLLRHDVSPSPQ
jgi:hypothetical protein